MGKSSSFHPVKDILDKVLGKGQWQAKLKQYSFLSQWEAIVGTKIAQHATPTLWRGTTLFVDVSNSSWLQELKMMEGAIIGRIKEANPEIKLDRIRWHIKS